MSERDPFGGHSRNCFDKGMSYTGCMCPTRKPKFNEEAFDYEKQQYRPESEDDAPTSPVKPLDREAREAIQAREVIDCSGIEAPFTTRRRDHCTGCREARQRIPALLDALASAEAERDARAAEARHWAEGTRAYMKRLDAAEAQLRAAGVTGTPLTSEGGHDANADTDGEAAEAQRRDAEGNAGGDADVSGVRATVGDEGLSVHGPADGGQGMPILQGRAGSDVAARPFVVELPGAIALIHRAEKAEARADAYREALRNLLEHSLSCDCESCKGQFTNYRTEARRALADSQEKA